MGGFSHLCPPGYEPAQEYVLQYECLCVYCYLCFQLRYLNQAMTLFDVSVVVPVNFAFFTINAILAGAVFYEVSKSHKSW